jgi:hypothetical protein
MRKVENPKRISQFESLYAPLQEGFEAPAPAAKAPAKAPATAPANAPAKAPGPGPGPAVAPAPIPLASQSINDLIQKKRQDFLDRVKNKSPSAADSIAKKITVQNIDDEINSILDSIDNLSSGNKDVTDLFNIDIAGDPTMNQMQASDLDTSKIMTQVNQATTQLSNIIRGVVRKAALIARLGVKETQSFMMSWNDNVHAGCGKIAQALTNNNATDYEVAVFVDQTQKFCMAFLIWIFIMNWYFVTFFVKENERWSFDPTFLRNFSITLYALVGPSYKTLQTFNWALVEVPSLLRYTLSKKVIFAVMLLIFIGLVSANFHMTILTDFFKSMEGQYSTSVFCVIAIFLVLGYAFWFAFSENESGWWQYMNVMKSIPGTVVFFFIILLYILVVAVMGIPLAMFFVSAFFVMYSFLGIFIYRGADTLNTFVRISEDISNLSEINASEYDTAGSSAQFDILKLHVYLWNAFYRGLRVTYAYAFELILLFILLGGISKYRGAFHDVMAAKVKANQLFAQNGPVADSFKHLFSWLLIINILLVIIIVIWMLRKWKTIQMLSCTPRNGEPPPSFDLLGMVKSVKDSIGEVGTQIIDRRAQKFQEVHLN